MSARQRSTAPSPRCGPLPRILLVCALVAAAFIAGEALQPWQAAEAAATAQGESGTGFGPELGRPDVADNAIGYRAIDQYLARSVETTTSRIPSATPTGTPRPATGFEGAAEEIGSIAVLTVIGVGSLISARRRRSDR